MTFRNDGDVFDLQNAIALIRYHAFGFHAIIVKHIHDATLKISAHHALLFIGEQQQWKETLPITGYLSDFHSGSPSHGHIDQQSHHTVRQSQPGHDSVGGLCVQWAGHHGRPQSEDSAIKPFRRFDDGICRQPSAHRSVNPPTEDLSVRQQPAGNGPIIQGCIRQETADVIRTEMSSAQGCPRRGKHPARYE